LSFPFLCPPSLFMEPHTRFSVYNILFNFQMRYYFLNSNIKCCKPFFYFLFFCRQCVIYPRQRK